MSSENEETDTNARRPVGWLLKAGAVAGAITALVVLGKTVVNAVSPPPPAVIRATVTDVRTEPHRTENVYFASHPAVLKREEAAFRKEGLTTREIHEVLQRRGVTVQFTVETQGPPGHAWYITESLYNNTTGAREPTINGNFLEEYRLVPGAGSRAVTFPSWIEYPKRPGVYFVEIEVDDKKGTTETGKSARFRAPG